MRREVRRALVMDVTTGEVLASASLPELDPDPGRAADGRSGSTRSAGGTFELGSIFKMLTVAMALDEEHRRRSRDLSTCASRCTSGRFTIKDLHPLRPAAVGARHLHPFVQRRRGDDRAGGGRAAPQAFLRRMRLFDADAHGSWGRRGAAGAEALGRDRNHDDRLRPRPGDGAAAVRRRAARSSTAATR